MRSIACFAAAASVFLMPAIRGQAPSGPRFEVASIKLSEPGQNMRGIRPAPGGQRYVATNATLRMMLLIAYRLKNDQLTGGPDWIDNEGYDMNAKAERPSSVEELHIMLQNLLAERFHLQFHRQSKELPVYVLS